MVDILDEVRLHGGTLWVAGNGPLRAVSLSSNVALLTALANDIEYGEVLRVQLEYYLQPDDAVLLISSSGNSRNVVSACEYAHQAVMHCITQYPRARGGAAKCAAGDR